MSQKPFRLYLCETLGRSCDISEKYKDILESEPAFYTNTVSKNLLLREDPDIPENFLSSFENGVDKYIKKVDTLDGPDEIYTWDTESLRWFVTLESLEDLDAFTLLLDVPLTIVRRDPANEFQREFLESIYGSPILEDFMVGELETTEVPKHSFFAEQEEDQDGESWKNADN